MYVGDQQRMALKDQKVKKQEKSKTTCMYVITEGPLLIISIGMVNLQAFEIIEKTCYSSFVMS